MVFLPSRDNKRLMFNFAAGVIISITLYALSLVLLNLPKMLVCTHLWSATRTHGLLFSIEPSLIFDDELYDLAICFLSLACAGMRSLGVRTEKQFQNGPLYTPNTWVLNLASNQRCVCVSCFFLDQKARCRCIPFWISFVIMQYKGRYKYCVVL